MILAGTVPAASAAALPAAALAAPAAAPAAPATGQIQAAPIQVGAHAPATPGLGGAAAALLLVLLLIVGLAWLLRRLPGSGFRQTDGLRVVASIPLGAKERAAVVQVGGEQLLLGIGPGGVRTLHRLREPLPAAPGPQQQLPDFRRLLTRRPDRER